MKVKHILIVLLIGLLLTLAGILFKFMHWPGANKLLLVSSFVKMTAIILGIWKILTLEKLKEMLNS